MDTFCCVGLYMQCGRLRGACRPVVLPLLGDVSERGLQLLRLAV
jgi:hypothetical protein